MPSCGKMLFLNIIVLTFGWGTIVRGLLEGLPGFHISFALGCFLGAVSLGAAVIQTLFFMPSREQAKDEEKPKA